MGIFDMSMDDLMGTKKTTPYVKTGKPSKTRKDAITTRTATRLRDVAQSPVRGLFTQKTPTRPMGLKEKSNWTKSNKKRTIAKAQHNSRLKKSTRRLLKKSWNIIW